jgi:hypothetical protein
MKLLAPIFIALAATLLSSCVEGGYYGSSYYGGYGDGYYGASNNYDCDYHSPPWGYPADYCRYQVWNQPVFHGGVWYGGPIYYRTYGGVNWYWLYGDWRRDSWRGARPRLDWNRGGNQRWRGKIHRGRGEDNDAAPNRGGVFFNNGRPNGRPIFRSNENNTGRPSRQREAGAEPPSSSGAGNAPSLNRSGVFGNNRARNGSRNSASRPTRQRATASAPSTASEENSQPRQRGGSFSNSDRPNGRPIFRRGGNGSD